MTDDDGLNGMLSADLGQYFARDHVYQLAPSGVDDIDFYVRSRVLFDESATHDELEARLEQGAVIDAWRVGLEGHAEVREGAIAMFVLSPDKLRVLTAGDAPNPGPDDELIGLAIPPH